MKNFTHKNFTIHQFDELESTNSKAFDLANSRQIFENEIILADKQTNGRGRQSRVWSSPAGNLYFSLVLCPKISAVKVSQISFVAIVAMQAVVARMTTSKVEVKWPNDLLINEKKVSGLLLESKISGENCEFVILGIGVNIASKPDNTIFPAAALKDFGVEILPENLLKNFLDEFEKLYQSWCNFGFSFVRKAWLENAFRLKKEITVKLAGKELRGVFEDFDEEGNLVLRCGDNLVKISTADVS
ncbi:MAG: biotin--[acetyl-CoA-carboxylase] ligase [Rickettsiales bacterium]|nr:biotin--[acetyl-CoA-carboxylase] ligase [Rickettsiales bacterium]